jgi:hypothetical protein
VPGLFRACVDLLAGHGGNMATTAATSAAASAGTQSGGRKQALQHAPGRLNDIFVTRATPFASQLERARTLLDQGASEVVVHAVGAAINRAICLALQV